MEWTRGPIIGRGSTATVSVATARSSGEVMAVKSAELSKSEPLKREQKLLSSLNSPTIISYRGFNASATTFDLLMELAPGGSLSDEICRRGGSLTDAEARACAREILLGLSYLHSEGVVHCDIKARNVLVTGEGLKIGDFGCARRHVEGCDWITAGWFCGTPAYMAPEVARGEAQDFAADIWAFGCTVIEMFTGRVSWLGSDGDDDDDPVSVIYRVGVSGRVLEIPDWVSEEGRDFLGKCLRREAEERWSASELLEHPFVAGVTGSVFGLGSPKSVLENIGFGESSDPGRDSGFEPPGERIGRLCGDNAASFCEMDDWAGNEGWVTVRGNWANEGPERLYYGPKCESGPVDEHSKEIIVINFGDNFACPNKFISVRNCCKYREWCGVSVRDDWKRGFLFLMMPSKCNQGHVYDRLDFKCNESLFFMHTRFLNFFASTIFGSLVIDICVIRTYRLNSVKRLSLIDLNISSYYSNIFVRTLQICFNSIFNHINKIFLEFKLKLWSN